MKPIEEAIDNYFRPKVSFDQLCEIVEQEMERKIPFSAKNFPTKGNESFSGAGERTQHSQTGKAFPTLADTVFVSGEKGDVRQKIPAGTLVLFQEPWSLYRGADIAETPGPAKKTVYAQAALENGTIGYVVISKVSKPPGGGQSRVRLGSAVQDTIMDILALRAKEEGTTVEKISSAKPGSTKPDLVVNYGGNRVQFEIKGRNADAGFISVFDKSSRRGVPKAPILETVAQSFIDSIEVEYKSGDEIKTGDLKGVLKEHGFPETFEGVIDFYQQHVSPAIGFCGDDPPVPKSGRLPSAFRTTNPTVNASVREHILDHLRDDSGDDYFTIYTRSSETADIYSTGGDNNPLGADDVPAFQEVALLTYGGCSSGATRVGFKIKLAPVDSNLPDKAPE